ncbi:hypothetical protein FH972_025802 [Carpinus fangiana]|uniref:Uncharacterized protein n=1 Tax=Carpinus fangiana TaxID=176857 RepID=A0A5N6L4N1_9ROSI|nr:hypothetical protein FH972_025802 [Carpinus fangiana]
MVSPGDGHTPEEKLKQQLAKSAWGQEASQVAARNAAMNRMMDDDTKRWVKHYRTEIAAMSASLCSTLSAVSPRLLLNPCALAPLMSITIVRTVSFSIYQRAKYTYDDWIDRATGSSPLAVANTRGALPTLSTAACFGAAGATSGALITVISLLMEKGVDGSGGKTANNAQKQKTPGTLGTARFIMKQRGFRGLYSGFHLHLIRDTIGTAIYFMTYESSKQVLANARGNSPTSPLAVVLAGGLCGLVSWACIYPIDSAKSIYQRNVLTADGMGGKGKAVVKPTQIQFFNRRMYRGLGVSMTRSCLINAMFFSVFELMKKQINRLDHLDSDLGSHSPHILTTHLRNVLATCFAGPPASAKAYLHGLSERACITQAFSCTAGLDAVRLGNIQPLTRNQNNRGKE